LFFTKIQDDDIFEEQASENNKNICCPIINSKRPVNSSRLRKLNLLVKTINHLFSKKKFRAVLVA
jgi:hypothetical protein